MKKTYNITVTVTVETGEEIAERGPNALDELFAPTFEILDRMIDCMKPAKEAKKRA